MTHGPEWKNTHGMGDAATCSVCHAAADCVECHGVGVPHEASFVDVHASYALQPKEQCSSCHKQTFCDACHRTAMPHPAGFTQQHPTAAKDKPELCERCHAESDCKNCHVKHSHPGGAVSTATVGGGAEQ